jgi:hypothetical protein
MPWLLLSTGVSTASTTSGFFCGSSDPIYSRQALMIALSYGATVSIVSCPGLDPISLCRKPLPTHRTYLFVFLLRVLTGKLLPTHRTSIGFVCAPLAELLPLLCSALAGLATASIRSIRILRGLREQLVFAYACAGRCGSGRAVVELVLALDVWCCEGGLFERFLAFGADHGQGIGRSGRRLAVRLGIRWLSWPTCVGLK